MLPVCKRTDSTLVLRDMHTRKLISCCAHSIYIMSMDVYIWDLSQVCTDDTGGASGVCWLACWVQLCTVINFNHWINSLRSHIPPTPSLCPLQNFSIMPDMTLLGSSLSPKQMSSMRHFPNLPLARLLADLSLWCCSLHSAASSSVHFINMIQTHLYL